ncbi:hypothetical protein HRbin21_01153 [bacterium HR21]|nr:hypothetical protein HRbin21_01153 [bacterium HR21]
MSALDGWDLLSRCLELTEHLDRWLASSDLGLEELLQVEQLYHQRQHLLERLRQWWDEATDWSPEQARKWLDMIQQLLERSTRQMERLHALVERSEQRLRTALLQRYLVRYEAQEYHGD